MHNLYLEPDSNRLLHRQRWTGLDCSEGWQLARVCSVKHHDQFSGGQTAAVGVTNSKRNRMASPVVASGWTTHYWRACMAGFLECRAWLRRFSEPCGSGQSPPRTQRCISQPPRPV